MAALGELENVSQSFLQTSRDYNATSEIYARDFAAVRDALDLSAGTATRQANIASEQVNLMQSQLAALGLINGSVLSMAAALGNYATAAAAAAAATAAAQPSLTPTLTPPPASVAPVVSASGNQRPTILPSDSAMVAAAKTLYMSATGGVLTSAYNQYVGAVGGASAISGWTGDPQDLREYYGFANGGTASSGLYVAGEHGAEIIEGVGATRIYPAEQTSALLARMSGGDNTETNKLLKEVVTELRALVNQGGAVAGATINKLAIVADKLDANKRELARAA